VASYAIVKRLGEFGGRASSVGAAVVAGVVAVAGDVTSMVGPAVPVVSTSSLPLQPTSIAAQTHAAVIVAKRLMAPPFDAFNRRDALRSLVGHFDRDLRSCLAGFPLLLRAGMA
jgi:hypothetical protein